MLLIGIDEAGYGPLLGPLCHGASVLRLPGAAPAASNGAPHDLWDALAPAVSRCPAPKEHPHAVEVDDSKRLYAGPRKLERLSRSVAVFLACREKDASLYKGGAAPALEALLPAGDLERLAADPWGKVEKGGTPANGRAAITAGETALPEVDAPAREGLHERLAAHKGCLLYYGARSMSARDYNARVAALGSKAAVAWERVADLLRLGLARAEPGEAAIAVVDRQGGRKAYAALLGECFGGAFVWTLEEKKESSAYKLDLDNREVRVVFREQADGWSLPVALASMAAKLAREAAMARFNAYFRSHDAKLVPTAGYYTDAQRFLKQTKKLRKALAIDDAVLVRSK